MKNEISRGGYYRPEFHAGKNNLIVGPKGPSFFRYKTQPFLFFDRILGQRGFSLLEIMIAVAILAASAMALLSAQGGAFVASQRAERLTQATLLARQKMVEIEMEFQKDLAKNKFPEDNVEQAGTFDEPFDDFRWSYSVKKIELPPPPGDAASNALVAAKINQIIDQVAKNARQVQLTVLWGDPEDPVEDQPQMTVTTHWVKLK